MIDIDRLKSEIDISDLIGRDTALKRVASTNGGEWAGPCPLCRGGTDRLRVWPERRSFWCRKCEKKGDVIAYVMARDGVEFVEACERLGAERSEPTRPQLMPATASAKSGPPSADWQRKAHTVVQTCEHVLWTDTGTRAREWLHARGLKAETLQRWHIGYLAGGSEEWREVAGLSVPCGIIIPGEVSDEIWYLKVRRASGNPKYCQVKDSRPALFGADTLRGHPVGVLCEGEFDAMLLAQEAGDLAGVCTLGSATAILDPGAWGMYLLRLKRLLVAYDRDDAGERGAAKLVAMIARARPIQVPVMPNVKDISDFWKAGGKLRAWLAFQMYLHGLTTHPVNDNGVNSLMPTIEPDPEAALERVHAEWQADPDPAHGRHHQLRYAEQMIKLAVPFTTDTCAPDPASQAWLDWATKA